VARIARVTLEDDLDGGHASETVFFSFEGRHYEIDLSAENAAKLREGLAPFVAAARSPRRPSSTRGGGSPRLLTDRTETAAIREWARQNDHKIAVRGRMPGAVLKAYREEVG
jgi:hypothetical protein